MCTSWGKPETCDKIRTKYDATAGGSPSERFLRLFSLKLSEENLYGPDLLRDVAPMYLLIHTTRESG